MYQFIGFVGHGNFKDPLHDDKENTLFVAKNKSEANKANDNITILAKSLVMELIGEDRETSCINAWLQE